MSQVSIWLGVIRVCLKLGNLGKLSSTGSRRALVACRFYDYNWRVVIVDLVWNCHYNFRQLLQFLNWKNHLEKYIQPKLNGNLFWTFLKSESWDMKAVLMMQVGQVAKPTSWDSQGHKGQIICLSWQNLSEFSLPKYRR